MDILILGGTAFLGPHIADALSAGGHRATLFNRGRSRGGLRGGADLVVGDRETDLHLLRDRRFDAVIDTCGFVPRVVRASVAALSASVSTYVFVSTISVYADPLTGDMDESGAIATIADPTAEEITGETYGPLKALCEGEVVTAMRGRALIVRPGLIVGPLDPTDRFTYWPRRFAAGGDVLVPGRPQRAISFIDVRDLAEWIVSATERSLQGVFNASGDPASLSMGRLVDACRAAATTAADPVWVPEEFLLANGVAPWSELPLWLPEGEDSLLRASSSKAVAAGLRYRPLNRTVIDTLAWSDALPADRGLKAGLSSDEERILLEKFRAGIA
jgi:2'-hydroxyisoflavone reductase